MAKHEIIHKSGIDLIHTRFLICFTKSILSVSEFYCLGCVKTFNTKKQLKAHRLSNHENSNSFQCTHCTKKYTRNEHLQTHLRTHTSDLQHSCQYCGLQFWRNSHQKRHYIVHKINNERDECACAVCGEVLKTNLLKKHMELV